MLRNFRRFFIKNSNTKKVLPFGRRAMDGVGRIIMTVSCKGGVGKSTFTSNTAATLQKLGNKIGIFDADIYGPSIPTMFNTTDEYLIGDEDGHFLPVEKDGIYHVSVGFATGKKDGLMWKGPILTELVTQFLRNSMFPKTDYLIIDTPPGTGDVPIAISTTVPVDGAVILTSPQDVAVADVIRNFEMLNTLKIPILGIVENFGAFTCPKCKKSSNIFQGSGADDLSKRFNIPLLGKIPFDPVIAKAADKGVPAVISHPDSKFSSVYEEIANEIMKKVPKQEPRYPSKI